MARHLVACDAGGTMTDVIEVETVPRACPSNFEFRPDLDTFLHLDWLR